MKFIFFLIFIASINTVTEHFKLLILHSNDIHGNFAGDDNGYGGCPKTQHLVKKFKSEAKPGHPVIYLNAGDVFSGSVWYSIHRATIAANFVKLMEPDAFTLGNHEFDEGMKELERFGQIIGRPMLCCNGDFTQEPGVAKFIRKSIVIQPNNTDEKIGIIGYINQKTSELAPTGKVVFNDDVKAVAEEAEKLHKEGIKIIIALGHSGYETDKKIAETAPHVDIVVGGHSHTFLYTGKPPTKEKVGGDYPTTITKVTGERVPVAQAGYGGKYLGQFTVTIDENGNVTDFDGQPILLDSSIAPDVEASELLEFYRPAVDALLKEVLGVSRVYLQGGLECRRQECNFANLITDALCEFKADQHEGAYWTDTPIGIINGGSIRASINASKREGNVTTADLYGALPHGNKLVTVDLNATTLLDVLELSVKSNGETSFGEFLQVSGLHVVFDMSEPPLKRVKKVLVRCAECDVPYYEPLNKDSVYRVVTTQYLAKGGDGYNVLKTEKMNSVGEDKTEFDVLKNHIQYYGIIQTNLQSRVTFMQREGPEKKSGSSCFLTLNLHILFIVCIFIINL